MGFIDAVAALGRMQEERFGGGELAELDAFTQMPLDLIEPSVGEKAKRLPGREIRIYLDVVDPTSECLDVRGIQKIDIVDFFSGEGEEREKKRRYLHRDIQGNNPWRYSPLYKLGRGVTNGRKELLGNGEDWTKDKNSRFLKLHNAVLNEFEKTGYFSPGSVNKIMSALVENVDLIAEFWSDHKRSYLLLFGLADNDDFLYPAEIAAFLSYFKKKIALLWDGGEKTKRTQKSKKALSQNHVCALCRSEVSTIVCLDKIFPFSTFDKKSFLPGLNEVHTSKVFPVCLSCGRFLFGGRNVLDRTFLDRKSLYGVQIYVVPELILHQGNLPHVGTKTRNFIETGLQNESFLAEVVLEQGDSLVYHFVFLEKNQAQERILLMLEDVPPTWLRQLNDLWIQSEKSTCFYNKKDDFVPIDGSPRGNGGRSGLDRALKAIVATLSSLSGKNDNDRSVFKELSLGLMGNLLNRELVDISSLKSRVVSRLQGLCSDSDWVAKYSISAMRSLHTIVDFLSCSGARSSWPPTTP